MNYEEIDLSEILHLEQSYADSVETHFGDSLQFYFRTDKYRFEAFFTGKWRKFSVERKSLMSSIFKMVGIDRSVVNSINKEVKISTSSGDLWMPIQSQLERPFKKEVPAQSGVYIYAFFINQHARNGLNNIFLISEFITLSD